MHTSPGAAVAVPPPPPPPALLWPPPPKLALTGFGTGTAASAAAVERVWREAEEPQEEHEGDRRARERRLRERVAHLEAQLAAREEELAEQRRRLAERDAHVGELQAAVEGLRAELAARAPAAQGAPAAGQGAPALRPWPLATRTECVVRELEADHILPSTGLWEACPALPTVTLLASSVSAAPSAAPQSSSEAVAASIDASQHEDVADVASPAAQAAAASIDASQHEVMEGEAADEEPAAFPSPGADAANANRPQLLELVSGLLHRKREALSRERGDAAGDRLQELDEDIARVERELAIQQSCARTPQKSPLQERRTATHPTGTIGVSNSSPNAVSHSSARLTPPSQGSTATPFTAGAGPGGPSPDDQREPGHPDGETEGDAAQWPGLGTPSPMPPSYAVAESATPSADVGTFQDGNTTAANTPSRYANAGTSLTAPPQMPVRPPPAWPWGTQSDEADLFEQLDLEPYGLACRAELRPADEAAAEQPEVDLVAQAALVPPMPAGDVGGATVAADTGDAVLIGSARPGVPSAAARRSAAAAGSGAANSDVELIASAHDASRVVGEGAACQEESGGGSAAAGPIHGTTQQDGVDIASSDSAAPSGRSALVLTQPPPLADSSSIVGKRLAVPEPPIRGKENLRPGVSTPPPPPRPSVSAEGGLPKAGHSAFAGVWASPPPRAALRARAASTPGRRVASSFGSSLGLFRETPSPHAALPQRSPVVLLQPRSLFTSPSPPRYSEAAEREPLDWASPIGVRSSGSTNVDEAGVLGALSSADPPLPPPLPAGTGGVATGRPATAHGMAVPAWCTTAPAQRGAIPVTALQLPLARSPSAPSFAACGLGVGGTPPRRTSGGGGPVAVGRCTGGGRSASGVARGGGDTPRNLTDWRRSLALARRQDEPEQGQRAHSRPARPVPWR